MPNYNTLASIPIPSVYPGDVVILFNSEQPSVPQASQQVALANYLGADDGPYSFSIELQFSGAPGVFEVDVQVADTDTDAAYTQIPTTGAITSVNTGNFTTVDF